MSAQITAWLRDAAAQTAVADIRTVVTDREMAAVEKLNEAHQILTNYFEAVEHIDEMTGGAR
ncbi:MAG: hypothetical protein ABW046_20780 [Actinoplanes sp.]